MSAAMIDSNVLLDMLAKDLAWYSWSAAALESAGDRFRLVNNAVICSEVSVRYSQIEDPEAAVPKSVFEREPILPTPWIGVRISPRIAR